MRGHPDDTHTLLAGKNEIMFNISSACRSKPASSLASFEARDEAGFVEQERVGIQAVN